MAPNRPARKKKIRKR